MFEDTRRDARQTGKHDATDTKNSNGLVLLERSEGHLDLVRPESHVFLRTKAAKHGDTFKTNLIFSAFNRPSLQRNPLFHWSEGQLTT